MKKQFFHLIAAVAVVFSMTFVSCTPEEEPKTGVDALIEQGVLTGELDHAVTLNPAVTYKLTGTFIVSAGGVLNIPAGTTIKASEGFGTYILVNQGGKINVNGTAEKPVVMTSDDNNTKLGAGYWGGLVINGKAKISGATGTTPTASCEMNAKYPYGGSDDADNSGSITYLMIKYAGARSSAEVEHNGLTLDAVGSGTVIENVFILKSADDGVECFGGTVALKNILVVNSDDDCFDNTQGYRGSWTNMYGIWEKGFTNTESDPRGVEVDGNLDGNTPTDINQTNFTITNMTIDLKLDYNTTNQTTFMQDVIKIRRGAKAVIANALVKGTGAAQDLVDCTDSKGDAAAGTTIALTNSLTNANTGSASKPGANAAAITIAAGNAGCSSSLFAWTGYTGF